MSWIQKLFGGAPARPPAVIIETGTAHAEQALCLKIAGAYIIDLSPLPVDRARVVTALAALAAKINADPLPIQVWVASNTFLERYVGNTDAMMELTDSLFAATKRVTPKMIVQNDAPAGVVYILRSLGFEVFLPGLKLTMVDAKGTTSELDVMDELERIRKAPRIRA